MFEIEIRSENSIKITGYVNAVGRDSRPVNTKHGRVVEQIIPGAFAEALRAAPNVDMLLNHDPLHKLGDTVNGDIRLCEDSIGLRAEAVITDVEVCEKARAGKLRGWSFGFTALEDELEQRSQGKLPRRSIKRMSISEVSLIDDRFTPCYDGTSVEVRADGDNSAEIRAFEDEVRYNPYHDPVDGRAANKAKHDYSYYEQAIIDHDLNAYELRAGLPLTDRHTAMKRNRESADNGEEVRFNLNHDEKGRFCSGKGLTGGGKSVKIDSKGNSFEYPELRLPKKEYGKVIHEINTYYHSRFKGQNKAAITIAQTTYRFEIHGFNEYNIYQKSKG